MMIKRPNTGVLWLAVGVSGTMAFAAVVLAVQGDYSRKMNQKEITVKPGSADLEISPQANSSPRIETLESTFAQVPRLAPRTDRQNLQPNAESGTSEHRPDPGRAITQHISRPKSRSSARVKIFDVKKRLVALWHQSLAHKRLGGWTLSADSKGHPKKVSYTSSTKN
jgi:hypothetical protein